MKYDKKSSNKSVSLFNNVDLSRDLDTLLRHKRRGIPITPAQEQIIRDSGRWNEPTNAQIIETARLTVQKKMKESPEAEHAYHDGGYYLQLLDYWYDIACSQILSGREINLTIPDPIPQEWITIGRYIKKSSKGFGDVRNTGGILSALSQAFTIDYEKDKYAAPAVPKEKTKLDLEIERQLSLRRETA